MSNSCSGRRLFTVHRMVVPSMHCLTEDYEYWRARAGHEHLAMHRISGSCTERAVDPATRLYALTKKTSLPAKAIGGNPVIGSFAVGQLAHHKGERNDQRPLKLAERPAAGRSLTLSERKRRGSNIQYGGFYVAEPVSKFAHFRQGGLTIVCFGLRLLFPARRLATQSFIKTSSCQCSIASNGHGS